MIDDEKRSMEEFDRRREERDRRLDEEWEYRDTDGYSTEEEKEDD
jgi:hypothetical protein